MKKLMWILQRNVPTQIEVETIDILQTVIHVDIPQKGAVRFRRYKNSESFDYRVNDMPYMFGRNIFDSLTELQVYHAKELNAATQDQQQIIDDCHNEISSLFDLKKLLNQPKYIESDDSISQDNFYALAPNDADDGTDDSLLIPEHELPIENYCQD